MREIFLNEISYNINNNIPVHNIVIRYYGQFDMLSFINISDSATNNVIKYSFGKKFTMVPLEPFLGYIKQSIINENIDIMPFLKEMECLENLYPVFCSYFETGKAVRKEHMWECVDFELENINKVLINMITYFSKKKSVIFILDQLHCAALSTMNLLHGIINNSIENVHIIGGYDELYPIQTYKIEKWNNIIKELDEEGYILEFELKGNNNDSDTIKYFDNNLIPQYLDIAENGIEFLQLTDAVALLEFISNKLLAEKIELSSDIEFRLYRLMITAYTFCKRHGDALLLCDKMLTNAFQDFTNEKAFLANYYLTRTLLILGQQDKAKQTVKNAIKYAYEDKNDFNIMLADMMNMFVKYSSSAHDPAVIKVFDKDLYDKMKKYNFFNHIIILTCICSENDAASYKDLPAIKSTGYQKAINMAKEHNNVRLMYSIYRFFIAKTANRNYNYANRFFHEEYLKIIKSGSNDEMYIQIGMGYLYMMSEQFKKAQEYFLLSLKSCLKLLSISHMAEIMYNMSMNAFSAQNYDHCIKYANLCIWIMDQMEYTKLFACNIAKLHALKALSYYYQNRKYLCEFEHKMMQQNTEFNYDGLDKNLNYQDLFFYYYVGFLLNKDNDNTNSAEKYLEHAEKYFVFIESQHYFCYVPFLINKAFFFRKLGRTVEADELINSAIKYCDDNGYVYKKQMALAFINNELFTNIKNFNLDISDESVKILKGKVEHQKMKRFISQINQEKEFLTNWQNIMSTSLDSVKQLTDDSFDAFIHHYNLDALLLLRMDNRQVYYAGNIKNEVIINNFNQIEDFFRNHKKEFLVKSTDNHYGEYLEIFRLLGCDKLFSAFGASFYEKENLEYIAFGYKALKNVNVMVASSEYMTIVESNLSTYLRLLRQLIDSIKRIENIITINEINKTLNLYAQTDKLTGIYNRAGLYEQIDIMLDNRNQFKDISIFYIDLDNFKYYNDSFGHEAGDIVLKNIAIILKSICDDNDFAARNGGDEFLVFIHSVDKELLTEKIENIYRQIKEFNYFVDLIEKEKNQKIEVDKLHRLTCSIGVCRFELNEETNVTTVEKEIYNADSVLYEIKKCKKGTYR
ncbi:MAG: GGDEF domain-containing protein, partial [Lachnospiraceae bacterium]|nr:GGDEF domain-containing protein [Lachnospiraceae bacterium]